MNTTKKDSHINTGLVGLTLGALGVVYGDIGTSPLYAMKEIFFGKEALGLSNIAILGVTSTIFWALTLIVSIKYVLLVLRADHQKEGGVFALYAILRHSVSKYRKLILGLLVFAAGLLFGDGVITPAISVISAVEGIGVVAPTLSHWVVPITLVILTGLFAVQKNGTSRIGAIFGPIMLVWFVVIGAMGIGQISNNLSILQSLNPIWVYRFVSEVPFRELLIILGFVMLVVTGGEAMYADLGHFGMQPIRLGWLAIAYPMLVVNYLGQGAYLMSGGLVREGSIFYSMAPGWAVYPLIVLATLATIIASQALITGAYSLAAQAYSLYLLPYLPTKHTHDAHEGQIYIRLVNYALYVGCVILVLIFQNSTNLASAYGLAVSGVMLVTTISVAYLAGWQWGWKKWQLALVFIPFAIIDSTFLIANSLKFMEGGYVPISIGVGLLLIMYVWKKGATKVERQLAVDSQMTVKTLMKIRDKSRNFTHNTVVIMSEMFVSKLTDNIPHLNQVYLERYGLLPEHLIFLTIHTHHEPYINKVDRMEIVPLDIEPKSGTIVSVRLNFGFMEQPEIEKYLHKISVHYPMAVNKELDKWTFHVIEQRILTNSKSFLGKLRDMLFVFMYRLALNEDEQFGLGKKYHVTAEVVPVLINK